jgi:mono/diheme cytochrome c family protein
MGNIGFGARISGRRGNIAPVHAQVTYCGARGKQLVSAAHATLLAGDGMRGIDSYTLNTVVGWVLGTGLLVFGLNALAGVVYHAETPEQPGMIVEVAAVTPAVEETDGDGPDIAALLAAADPAAGESAARACQACHTFDQGGAHRVGPNLWDIVGRPIAQRRGLRLFRCAPGDVRRHLDL